MKTRLTFSQILQASLRAWRSRSNGESLLSLAVPLLRGDPLVQLPCIADQQQFSFLWDSTPGLCIAAAGKCQTFELVGQRRFELAQRFADETLERVLDASPQAPAQAKPKILLCFTFFEQTVESKRDVKVPPGVQAVFPRWQLTSQGGFGWLRFNAVVGNDADVRDFAEQLWLMREKLSRDFGSEFSLEANSNWGVPVFQNWENSYRLALMKGIELVDSGSLKKLVLAVRQSVVLKNSLEPLPMLARLRHRQPGSCRFLWKRSKEESFFGASPERLLTLRNSRIIVDALAGTAKDNLNSAELLQSEKDLREHELVVSSIKKQLMSKGLVPFQSRTPRLARHGHLIHLHTPIFASNNGNSPLQLVDVLHPTPAVAGLPKDKALKWLRTLEPFDRGSYAAPIGWIDDSGNAEFRVAIRCGYARGNVLDLIAGAGIVRGSVVEAELHEVGLKLAVLAEQLSPINFQENFFSKEEIT